MNSEGQSMSLSRIEMLTAELVGDENTLPGNIFFIGPDREARLLEYAVELIRPALPELVFFPLVEFGMDDAEQPSVPAACRQGEWDLQCLVLGPKFFSDDNPDVSKAARTCFGADLVLGEDVGLYVLDWSEAWIRKPDGPITYSPSARRYETFKDAFDDGWGPVELYIQQIESRLETVVQLHPGLPKSGAGR